MGKKHQNPNLLKTVSNKHLAISAALVLLAVGFVFYWGFLAPDSHQAWVKLQAEHFSSMLSKPESAVRTSSSKPFASVALPILMYHHVGALPPITDKLRRDMTVDPHSFESQAAWLKGQGFESITLNDLLLYSRGKFTLPPKPVIFTFDDGYSDVFENAAPLLKKYGFTGSFAIITQFPGITQGANTYATWQQIREAQKIGMEIVSHTQDHFDGTDRKYDAGFILRNLSDSRKDLMSNLGLDTQILIYPYGHYNKEYIDLAKQAGFELGLTTKFGQRIYLNDLMEVPRVRVHGGEDLEQFKKIILEGERAAGGNDYQLNR